MKKTLLASALLLAFSSLASAATYYGHDGLHGASSEITSNSANANVDAYETGSGERVLGGWYLTNTTDASVMSEAKEALNSNVIVSGGKFNYVVGGHYAFGTEKLNLNVSSTNVTINGKDTAVYFLAAGTASFNGVNLTHTGAKSSSLTINDGIFGLKEKDGSLKTNVYELTVLGGDLVKAGNNGKSAESKIESISVEINDGTFNAAVIGGSAAYGNYETPTSLKAEVGTVDMKINGGTFNHAIVAGGMSGGHNAKSIVKSTSLSISGLNGNLEINENIYAGGLYTNTCDDTELTVERSTVSIDNEKIVGVYGTSVEATLSGAWDAQGTKWLYNPLTKKTVQTKLNLTNVQAQHVEVMKGEVNLRAEDEKQTIIDKLSVAEDGSVKVTLTTDGATNDKYKGKIKEAIVIKEGWDYASAEEITMAEGLEMGEVTLVDGKLIEKTNSVMSNTLDLASAAPLAMNRLLMNDVRKRMGDLRSAEGTHGVWARYDGGKLSGSNSLENDFTTIQVGIDTVPVADAPRFGVAFAYTMSDADMKRGGAEMDAYSLAFYGTKMYDNGMFVDVIGRMATADTDVTIDGDKKGTMDNVALSLSGEFGWRFDVTDTFYVEPQAELTYTYVNADTLTLSDKFQYKFDSVDSLMGRVGFAAGFKCPNNFGDVYVRASAVHEFLGDATVTGASGKALPVDGEDTWVEFGIGANFNVNKNTYVYADIERTEGAKLEEDWRANVGVRYAF